MKIMDLQYLQNLAKDQAISISERFELDENETDDLESSLLLLYELFVEND